MQRRPFPHRGAAYSRAPFHTGRDSEKSDLAALSGLRRPSGRLVLGLVALLAWPLLARLGAALLARPRLRLRLPALVALLLLALAHQFLLRLVPPRRSVP